MSVVMERDQARVKFDAFDLDSFRLFLRCKTLPEKRLSYSLRTGGYELTTPARFAGLLDPQLERAAVAAVELAPHLFDYQRFIVERALEARRYAIWADTGLGKTAMFLEFARQVVNRTAGRVLILSPLAIIEQTRAEHQRFYNIPGENFTANVVERIDTRAELAEWCTRPGPGIGITNYQKLIEGVLDELRHLAGLILDESSILKTGGGVTKWNLIKSGRGIEYKLSCTATPAPNDTMEYASQAAFLEKLRNEGEILWTFFSRDKHGTWSVKPHARDAFFRFMASWSIYLRNPANYGWGDILASLPEPEYFEHRIPITEEQRRIMQALQVEAGTGMFGHERMGVRERAKFAQLARGFMYRPGSTPLRVEAGKPDYVAGLIAEAMPDPTLVWTTFDEEGELLAWRLRKHLKRSYKFAVLSGKTPEAERLEMIAGFQSGAIHVLVSKPQLLGYGLNFQNCRTMVFSGFDDSFERMYQAVRRAYRYGQTETVRVHLPFVPELEGVIFDNLRHKEARFMAEAAEQEAAYLQAMRALGATR